MSGIDYLRAIVDGALPQPPIAGLMQFDFVEVEPGRAVFTCVPDESAYNPIGAIHGGLICTLLDSVTGCAVHTTLPQGKGYTSVEIKVNYLKAVRPTADCSPRTGHGREGRFAGRLRRRRRDRRGRGRRRRRPARYRFVSPSRGLRPLDGAAIMVIGADLRAGDRRRTQRPASEVTVIEERTDTSSGAGSHLAQRAGGTRRNRPWGRRARGGRQGDRGSPALARRQVGCVPPERLVKALGEPLVVIRRSALTKVLAARCDGTVTPGYPPGSSLTTGRRRAGHAVGTRPREPRLRSSVRRRPSPAAVARHRRRTFHSASRSPTSRRNEFCAFLDPGLDEGPPARAFAVCTDSDRPEELAAWWAAQVGAEVRNGPDGTPRWLHGSAGWEGPHLEVRPGGRPTGGPESVAMDGV